MKKDWFSQNKIKITFFILFVFIFGGGIYIYFQLNEFSAKTYQELERGSKSVKRVDQISPLKDNISILIMGEDNSETREDGYGKNARTDALLLAAMDNSNGSVNLVSIPRDTKVYIPIKEKADKIAHAHAFGGVDSTVDTVGKFLDIPIDYYIKFNFDSFLNLIDVIGGIDINVPITFTEQDSHDTPDAIHIQKGYQHLNGEQALALARTRYIDNDFMRGKRQQLIIEAISQKLVNLKSLSHFEEILDEVSPNISTNLNTSDLLSIVINMLDKQVEINKQQIKCTDNYTNGIYYAQPDRENIREISKNFKRFLQQQ